MKTIKRYRAAFFITIFGLDFLFFTSTNPDRSSFAVVLLGYILILATVYAACRIIQKLLIFFNIIDKEHKWLVEIAAVLLWALIIMQSVGQLSLMDVVVLFMVSVIGYFYYTFLLNRASG